MNPAKLHHHN